MHQLARAMPSALLALILLAPPFPASAAPQGSYPMVEILARDRPERDVAGFPYPVHVLRLSLAGGDEGWTSGFSDRWHASRAFPGSFLREFSEGLAWYLEARGFEVARGEPGALHVKITFTEFEGRKRFHNDGGDLKARVQVARGRQALADEELFETRTYLDQDDERREFSRELGLKPVPFDTVLFYRLSRGMFESIGDLLIHAGREVDAPDPEGQRRQEETGSGEDLGYLSIQSVPPDAEIYLDGLLIATSPAPEVGIPAGQHDISIRKSGYEDWARRVLVLKGNRLTIRATLRAAGGD